MPVYLNSDSERVNRYDINFYEKNSIGCVNLEVNTDHRSLRYRIETDWNHQSVEVIYRDLLNGLSYAFDYSKDMYLDDFSEPDTILVKYPNGDLVSYSSSKESI